MAAKIGSYKGHATISLNAESKYPFTFGVSKAVAVLANIDAIREFVAANGGSIRPAGDAAPAGIGKSYPCRDMGGDLDDRIADETARAMGLNGEGR